MEEDIEDESINRLAQNYFTQSVVQDSVQFHIHYTKEKIFYKNKVIQVIKNDLDSYHRYFNYRPQSDVHFLIVSATEANGLASVFPYNVITLNDFPPVETNYLANTKDWIRQLVVHEYIHILTMDMTKGYINNLRYVFGSMVKTNAVIPRWLSEGVAVWAESRLVQDNNSEIKEISDKQGRTNSLGVLFEVYQQFKNNLNCNSISCLDYPQYYPFGHLRYWAGGLFVEYIEDNNPGAVSCIFNDHSDGIPFYLNSIFESCIGSNVENTFMRFRNSFLKNNSYLDNYCPVTSSVCKNLEKYNLASYTDWQKGSCHSKVVIRNHSSSDPLSIAHVIYDTSTQKSVNTDFPIDRLMQVNNDCLVALTKNRAGLLYRDFYLLADETLTLQKHLKNSDQVVQDSNNKQFYPLRYQSGQWYLFKGNKKLLISSAQNIISPSLNKGSLAFVTEDGKKRTLTLPAKKMNSEYSSKVSSKKKVIKNAQAYRPFQFMTPSYWYFLFSNIGNLNRVNLITSLSDPLERHKLSLQYDFFEHPDVPAQSGGAFFYNLRKNSYTWSAGYSKTYSLSLFNSTINSSEFNFVGLQKTLDGLATYNAFGVTLFNSQLADFISKRNTLQVELSYDWIYSTTEIRSFVKSMQLRTKLLKSRVQGYDDFYGVALGYNSRHFITNKLFLSASLGAGKYYKQDLTRGYLSGGGFSSFFTGGVTYPFFAVNQGDIFGNEIYTSRLMFNHFLKDLFWGKATTPAFLEYLNFNFGVEYAKSKYIALGDKLFVDDYAQAMFAGLSLNSKLFYGVPVEFNLLATQMIHPKNNSGLLFYFNASLF